VGFKATLQLERLELEHGPGPPRCCWATRPGVSGFALPAVIGLPSQMSLVQSSGDHLLRQIRLASGLQRNTLQPWKGSEEQKTFSRQPQPQLPAQGRRVSLF